MTVHVPVGARQREGKPSVGNLHTFKRGVDGIFFRGNSRDGVRLEDLWWFVGFLGLEFRPLVCKGEGWFSVEGEQDLCLVTWEVV